MRILSATVRNYRVLKECTVDFDPSRTVIGAPNESGKSTLAEAIHHGFFLRSRVTGAVQKAMLSEFAEGPPSVEIRFEAAGHTYEIKKVFSGTPAASTTLRDVSTGAATAEGGRRILRNEAAEARIHEILGADDVGGGRNVESRIRFQWGHLWVWQGAATENPLVHANSERHAELLRERLARLDGGGVLESSVDAAVGHDVLGRHAATFTDKGRPRSGSALDSAITAEADAQAAHTRAATLVTVLDESVAIIETAGRRIAECDTTIQQARAEMEQVRVRQQEATVVAIQVAEDKAAVLAADSAFADVLRVDTEIANGVREIESLESRLGPDLRTLADLEQEELEWATRCDRATDEMFMAGKRHAAAATAFGLSDAVEKYLRLLLEREGLGGRCARISAQRDRARGLGADLAKIPAVAEAALAELNVLDRARESAEAALAATATKIDVVAASVPVTIGGTELASGQSLTITSAADISVGDAARLHVTPGGRSLADAATTVREARHAIDARLALEGVASIDAAREAYARRQMLAADLHAAEQAIEGLGGDAAEADLRKLDVEVAKAEREISSRSPRDEQRPHTLPEAQEALAAAERSLSEAGEAMATMNTALAASKQHLHSVAERRRKAAEGLLAAKAELAAIQTRVAVLEERYGPSRKLLLQTLAAERARAAQKLDASRNLLRRLNPEGLELDRQRLERTIATASGERQDADTKRHLARGRLELEGTTDPRADLARATVRLRLASADRVRAERDAAAVGLLAALFDRMKREVEAQYVAPLATRVSGYLDALYGAGTTVGVTYEDGRFTGLSLTRRGVGKATFDFGQLSVGAREQVAAAFRLAMAEVLAEDHDGALPVVFDDSFVNSDSERQHALQRLLDRGATRGLQVIVLSCRPGNYAMLGATTVTLPPNPLVA